MSYPFLPAIFETQDKNDDDAIVIDELVQPTSAPADPKGAIVPVTPETQWNPKGVTRLYPNTIVLSGGAQPYPILPEDVNRGTCKLKIYSSAATPVYNDYVIINDERGKISGGSLGINIVGHHGQTIDLDGHTGAVWVTPGTGITASIEVTAWGVSTLDGSQLNND